jgi:hypothetical protein
MVEILKTNISQASEAKMIQELVYLHFPAVRISLDLEDCDKVLRIQTEDAGICISKIIRLLRVMGYKADILTDELPSIVQMMLHETKYYSV